MDDHSLRVLEFARVLDLLAAGKHAHAMRRFDAGQVCLDIGANGGQSALEFGRLRPDARIASFEANPDNLTDLRIVNHILGRRHEFHHVALSDKAGSIVLHIPLVRNTPVPGEASLHPEVFDNVQDRLGPITGVLKHTVAARTLDSFGLAPDFVKIDVQGHEPAVLRGMINTLKQHRPGVMLENGGSFEDIRAFLSDLGYAIFTFDPRSDTLHAVDRPDTVNFIALPQGAGTGR